jgi:hypothetical protein
MKHQYCKDKFTYDSRQIRVFQKLQFENFTQENFEYEVHQVGPNRNYMQNCSSLACKEDAAGVVQISVHDGGGT